MSEPAASTLTERQRRWFASVRANLEANTGKSLAEWVEIGRGAPQGGQRGKLKWFKETHGLLQNSAMFVLHELEGGTSWDDAATAARAALWSDPAQRAILEAVERAALAMERVVCGQRKAFTAFSRGVQFAALAPQRRGPGARLGLALEPGADPRLAEPRNESWSERLHAVLVLPDAATAAEASVGRLLEAAWERS